ncbi:MAG: FAD-dependent oxidoreductase, partial [bacterium]|nr:FAD-dependent oxidoreductase [bacterium]
YPLAVENIRKAIEKAREYGFLGKNILGTDFCFDIRILEGAGAFVCGEETSLIHSIEGMRGVPTQRPPYPAKKGLFNKPTNINNVETLANVSLILKKGADWFSKTGTETSKGTKIFSLVGKVRNTGLVEVPMGTTLREIIFEMGGGIPDNKAFKAVQTGGPSGGCIPKKLLDLPIDYESLAKAGSIMGSGGMIVLDERTCMVDLSKYFLNFLKDESCGKCVPCREGIQRMHQILTKITDGKATLEHLSLLEELANVVKNTSMCGLGQTSANPVLATLKYFKDEYLEHILRKRCKAMVCKEIVSSPCQHACPIDTDASVYISLISKGEYEEAVKAIDKNPFSGVLSRVCSHPCEGVCRSGDTGEPIGIRDLKRFAIDWALKNNKVKKIEIKSPLKNEKIAIIGAGPSGLSCAFFLAKEGYQVTVFEKQAYEGGMLVSGIPKFRLPRDIVKNDIDHIKKLGVKIELNKTIGKDFTLEDLKKQRFKAIYLAMGAYSSIKLNIPGEDAKGVYHGIHVLESLNISKNISLGPRVGIIGGGNAAIDAARGVMRLLSSDQQIGGLTEYSSIDAARGLLRTGSVRNVTIYYRRTIAEMPAYHEEIDAAFDEGVEIEFLVSPKKIIKDSKTGKLKGVEFIKMALGKEDESGRRRPEPIPGSEYINEFDSLIIATGEKPDVSYLNNEGLEITDHGTISVQSAALNTNIPGIFAGGDVVTGPNTVVDAISAGKTAAASIIQFCSGKKIEKEYKVTRPCKYIEPVELTEEEIFTLRRQVMPRKEKTKVLDFQEVEIGLTEEQAIKEAKRCLHCDLETTEGKQSMEKLKTSSSNTGV